MRLEVTLVGGPGPFGSEQVPATELSVTWPPGSTVSGLSLERALLRSWPGHAFTVAGDALAALVPGVAPLRNGAVVVAWPLSATGPDHVLADSRPHTDEMPSQRCAALLVVTSGPGAGAVFELHRGSYTIGRGRSRIRIADPALSRHHCTLTVGPHSITLAAAPGSGGVLLYPDRPGAGANRPASAKWTAASKRLAGSKQAGTAVPVRGGVRIEVGQPIGAGSSILELRFQDDPIASVSSGSGKPVASTGFPATGLARDLLDASVLNPLEVPHEGGPARGRIATAATALVALVFGVVLAMATGSWMFLAFSAMGALTLLVPMVGGSGRRKALRRAVDRAVAQDVARLALTFPDAGSLLLAAHTKVAPSGSPGRAAGIGVRLGTGTRSAAVTLTPNDPGFVPPQVPLLPVCARLGTAPVQLRGPGAALRSMLHYVLMQLDAAAVPVVVLGQPQDIPLAARLLPFTTVTSSPAAALRALKHSRRNHPSPGASPATVLVMLNMAMQPSLLNVEGVAVLNFSESGLQSPASEQSVEAPPYSVAITTSGNLIAGRAGREDFVPDGVPATVFANYARCRAGSSPSTGEGKASDAIADLGEQTLAANILPGPEHSTPEMLRESWHSSAGGALRPVPVGRSASGAPMMFDFAHDGPHLLLAGTTGSGKSELLRVLVGSLAVCHSPADMQFVFIDFKGGAGLGALSKLPHTSSLITDLGGHGMDRTLSSLRAELHRREAAMTEVEASDSEEYRAQMLEKSARPGAFFPRHTMAHLMIVIDEFRILVDQFPDAMNELMRIAAVGRSLGIHLIMATQRPQGALSADIRANVTSSICLRVQSPLDSLDVIGTAQAASIDVAAPGRAFISRAGRPPEEFQTATLRLPQNQGRVLPLVERAGECLAAGARGQTDPPSSEQCGSDVAAVAALMDRAWQEALTAGNEQRPAAAVVAEDLPLELSDRDLEAYFRAPAGTVLGALPGPTLTLGLVDVPQGQSLEALRWHPASQSHLALFGTVRETSRTVALVAERSVAGNACTGAHSPTLLYLLDGDGSLAPFSSSPWTGACLTPGNLRATARLIRRLASTVRNDPRLHMICLTHWGRWVSTLRSSPWHGTEDELAELLRSSPPNLVVAAGGGRELLSASFLAAIPNRMFFSHGSNAESTMLWPRLPRFKPLPGRAAISGPINNFSSAHHGTDDLGAGETLHIAQLAQLHTSERAGRHRERQPECQSPVDMLQVQELPSRLAMADFRALLGEGQGEGRATATATAAAAVGPTQGSATAVQRPELLLGVGGDGLDRVSTLLVPGSVLPVLGGPGTGKSTFVRALLELHEQARIPTKNVFDVWPAGAGNGAILLLDDASSLSSQQLLAATQFLAAGGSIVAVVPHPGAALSRIPMEWGVRTAQQAIVLMPRGPGDGDVFGIRLETTGCEPPGRAVLLDRGRSAWFQFPLPEDAPVPEDASVPEAVREPGFPPQSAGSTPQPWV